MDASQRTGWSTDARYDADGKIDPRHLVVRLPAAVDVSSIAINPSGNCGDDPSASTGDYRVETSTDGQSWTVASTGHFGVDNRDRMNEVQLAAGSTSAVRYLRYTMLGTQVAEEGSTCPAPYAGCFFVDTVEIGVYGSPHWMIRVAGRAAGHPPYLQRFLTQCPVFGRAPFSRPVCGRP